MWDLILELAKTTKLSDIHIHAGAPLAYREYGDMMKLERVIEAEEIRDFLQEVLPEDDFVKFIESKDHDFAIEKDHYL
jgi:Tfp pilus assembly pilus retraction ATPase PilT